MIVPRSSAWPLQPVGTQSEAYEGGLKIAWVKLSERQNKGALYHRLLITGWPNITAGRAVL